MRLQDLKIKSKLLLLIALMSIVTGVVSFFGVTRLYHANESTIKVDKADGLALLGARLNQNVIGLRRYEYRIAADPSAESVAEVKNSIDTTRKQFDERITQAEAAATTEVEKQKLAKIRTVYDSYIAGLDRTYDLARKTGSEATLSEAHQNISAMVKANKGPADTLQDDINAYADMLDDQGGKLAAQTKAEGERAIIILISVAVGGLTIGFVVGLLLANHGISGPLNRSVEELRRLANGDLQTDVTGANRRDECGDIAKGLAIFKDNALKTRELEAEAAEQKARAEVERRQVMMHMADDFEKSVGGIVGLVSSAATEMQAAAAQLTSTAQETSAQSMAVSSAAEEAGANVASVAASTEELGASVSEIGRQIETSAQISTDALTESGQAALIVEELNEVASSIGGFVDLISGLASQTNLLALNATIESARAGEAGKGFAVVASEVKALAGQTARATTEISEKITQIQQATARASTAMKNIGGTIQKINSTSTAIASAVEQQNAATQEIVQAVSQAAVGTTEVTSNISGVAIAAEQTGAAAAQVLSSSSELAEQAERLHHEMDKFLSTVRAA